MNKLTSLIFIAIIFITSCNNPASNNDRTAPAREVTLMASTTSGSGPLDITFSGTFHPYTDSIKMNVPDMFLMGVPGKTIIRYSLPDTFVMAKKSYVRTEHFSSSGSYSVYMVLQTQRGDIYSDTLQIDIR
jgi:hypothetical protein